MLNQQTMSILYSLKLYGLAESLGEPGKAAGRPETGISVSR